MASNKVTPILLAGSIVLAGFSLLAGPVASVEAREIDMRVTSVDDLTDVNKNHWAYEALSNLVEKYDVIEGYPNRKFKGNQFTTRYEMAAALNDLMVAVGRDMARLGADRADFDTLAKLQDEFKTELAALNARAGALENRAAAIEAKNVEQDDRLTLLEKTQVHGDMSVGLMSTLANNPGGADPQDALQAIARLRLALDIPVYDGEDSKYLGEGRVRTRLIGAFGNNGAQGGFSGLSRIASDASNTNEGFGSGTPNSTSRANVYIERMYYEQDLKPGIPVLTDLGLSSLVNDDSEAWKAKGTVFGGVYPFRDFFDKSAYRGDEVNGFQNPSFVNIPGLPSNLNFTGVGYKMNQGLGKHANFQLTAATGAPNTNDLLNFWTVNYEARLNYLFDLLGEKSGSFYAGGFNVFNQGSTANAALTNPIRQRNGNPYANSVFNGGGDGLGVYAGLDQEIYKGIGFNVGYMYNNVNNKSTVLNTFNPNTGTGTIANGGGTRFGVTPKQALTVAFKVPLEAVAPGLHDGDHLGVGYALVDFNDLNTNIGAQDKFEQVMETYYAFYLNDQISFVPSFQLAQNRLGLQNNDVSMAIGFRTNVRF
jgi:S-layer homology domain